MTTFDFTKTYWGHTIKAHANGDTISGLTISTPCPRAGDEIRWATEYGTGIGRITSTTYVRDPDDMQKFEAAIIRRLDHGGEVLWEADDE